MNGEPSDLVFQEDVSFISAAEAETITKQDDEGMLQRKFQAFYLFYGHSTVSCNTRRCTDGIEAFLCAKLYIILIERF